jgi:Domain of unknown function (DUF4175)
MTFEPTGSDRRAELIDVIHRVRNRWRLKLALRGAVIVVAGTLAALFLSASSLEALRFSPTAIISFRVLALLVFSGLVFVGFVQPLRRRVTDSQVALYLEEKDPTLEAAILSAIESSSLVHRENIDPNHLPSPHLVEKLVDQAIDKCRALENGLVIERAGLKRQLFALVGVAGVAALIITFGPAFLRSGMSALLRFASNAVEASPYKIEVTPGNTKIPRGADQSVKAKLLGFSAPDAVLMVRLDPAGQFDRVPLVPASDPASFEGMLFHIEKTAEYYVVSNGVESPRFKMDVLDLPTVDKLVLEYHFPDYTGLQPRTVDPGGDIAAIKGTQVHVKITPTMATPGGRVLLNDNESAPLTKEADGTLAANFTVNAQGFYKIELEGPHAEKVNASPQYTIDVLSDVGPSVHFNKPGRDTTASPVEEVFAEVKADDDFGVKQLQMFYSVNGGAEKTVNLFGGAKSLPEVTATHTIYLEEMGLKPGDFVSYYAKAADNDAVAGGKTTTSDIYFVQIKPFRKDYKQAQSMAGGGGGGGGAGNQVGQLSQQQREIVAATFNTVRDKAKMTAEKYRENTVFLTLAQAKLRDQVEELSGKMNSRLDAVDPAFKTIAEALPKAAAEMKTAESNLKGQQAKEALSPEQRALKLLQDAEQEYEIQVSTQRGGGGGGGGQSQMSEDLADLFELEMDKLANQYELQQRAEQQSGDKQLDELAEKLKELARRQQQEAERQRRLAAAGQSQSGGGGGDLQRQIAQELEEAARRLQQLTREQERQNLQEAARNLQEAANAMRQAAANGSKDGGAQAQAALDKLRQAQQKLQNNQSGRGDRDVQQALKDAQDLANEQKDIANEVAGLDGQQGAARQAKAQSLAQRKDAMDQKVAGLQDSLEKLANEARGSAKDAARRLDEAAGSITDKRVREKIRYTKNTLQGQASEYARAMESDIQSNLEQLADKIKGAQSAFGQANKQDALGKASDRARDLVRGVESLGQRMQDRAQQAQRGQQGQQGQQNNQRGQQNGQQGQQGQQSQQSQSGQQGQQGQQGQAGQSGQQGGQSGQQSAQGGQNGGQQGGDRNAGGAYGGNWGGGYWNGNRWVGGYYNPDDIRQFRNEWRQWEADAQALRQQLQGQGVDVKDLDQALRDLRNLQADQAFVDPSNLAALQASALDKLKKFEFNLRKKSEGGDQQLSLSGSDEVPAGFRTAIEEYYRALAKKQ